MAPPSPDEVSLVRRLLQGDGAAFSLLLTRYHGRLLRLAAAHVGSAAIAEEVVQECWEAVVQGLPRFAGRSSLKTWIFQIVINRSKTRAAREGRQVPFSALEREDAESEPAVDPSRFAPDGHWVDPPRAVDASPEELLSRRELVAALEQAVAELPPLQRQVVTLRDIEGLTSEEACEVLEISEGYQRVLLHRARSKLRGILEKLLSL